METNNIEQSQVSAQETELGVESGWGDYSARYEGAAQNIEMIRDYENRQEHLADLPRVQETIRFVAEDKNRTPQQRAVFQEAYKDYQQELQIYEKLGLVPDASEPWYKKVPLLNKLKSPQEKRLNWLKEQSGSFEEASKSMRNSMLELERQCFYDDDRDYSAEGFKLMDLFRSRSSAKQRKLERELIEASGVADSAYSEITGGQNPKEEISGYKQDSLQGEELERATEAVFEEQGIEIGMYQDKDGGFKSIFADRLRKQAEEVAIVRFEKKQAKGNMETARDASDARRFLYFLDDYKSAENGDVFAGGFLAKAVRLESLSRRILDKAKDLGAEAAAAVMVKMEGYRDRAEERQERLDSAQSESKEVLEELRGIKRELVLIREKVAKEGVDKREVKTSSLDEVENEKFAAEQPKNQPERVPKSVDSPSEEKSRKTVGYLVELGKQLEESGQELGLSVDTVQNYKDILNQSSENIDQHREESQEIANVLQRLEALGQKISSGTESSEEFDAARVEGLSDKEKYQQGMDDLQNRFAAFQSGENRSPENKAQIQYLQVILLARGANIGDKSSEYNKILEMNSQIDSLLRLDSNMRKLESLISKYSGRQDVDPNDKSKMQYLQGMVLAGSANLPESSREAEYKKALALEAKANEVLGVINQNEGVREFDLGGEIEPAAESLAQEIDAEMDDLERQDRFSSAVNKLQNRIDYMKKGQDVDKKVTQNRVRRLQEEILQVAAEYGADSEELSKAKDMVAKAENLIEAA